MYSEIAQGREINIQGLKCHIPPEGYVWNIVTRQLEKRDIYKRSDIKEEQYWERIALPYWYRDVMKRWDAYEKKKKDDDADFYDSDLEQFKKQEWDRRLNGFWFLNNGIPVYITGAHYMFLQWWLIDVGYPKFRFPDLEYFYFLQYCIEDDACMGMIEITKRRFGKTFRAGLFLTEYTTRTRNVNAGIQSKTGGDAKKLFAKAVVNPFKKLPRFFRPEYDMSLGVTPKTEMRFQQTNVRGKKAEDSLDKEELGSMIDHQSADTVAYDGQKLHRYVSDEFAKTTECNIYDRHEVVRYCLLDDEGRIIGKALYTTTVEKLDTDKDGVQEAAKLLWDESDHMNRQENGRTGSGLYRFFMTADRARNFDIYGYPDVEKTIGAILLDRKSVEHNPRALSARIRKEARTVEEAWSIDADKCVFNTINIGNGRKFLAEEQPYLRTGMFKRDKDSVKWEDNKNGLWQILSFPPNGEENKFKFEDKRKKPNRIECGLIGVDSYSGYQTGRKYGSMACGFIYDKQKRQFIGMYYGRPQYKEQLHEQIMLAGEYYGFKIYYECTADDYEGYFRLNNKISYLGRFPLSSIDPSKRETTERLYGFPITPYAMTKQLDAMILYVEYDWEKIYFDKLFEQCLVFDPYNRTESDCVVAAMICLVTATEVSFIAPPPKQPLIDIYQNEEYAKFNKNGQPINLESLVN